MKGEREFHMGLNSIVFLSEPLETVPWFFQQMVLAIAYVLLLRKEGRDGETKKSILKMASESIVLLLLFIAASLFFMGFFTKHFLVLWCVFQAVLLGAYFYICSHYKAASKLALWCSMYAVVLVLMSLSGEASYVTGYYVGQGVPEAAARVLVYMLAVPLAWYLGKFNFNEFEKFPVAGMLLIMVGDISLVIMTVTSSIWVQEFEAINTHKQLLIAYLCMVAIVMVSIYALYTICKEQEEATLLKEQQSQLIKERERFTMAEQQVEEIRSIRHDLKNQRHYMRILLEEERYEDLKRYFDESQEKVPIPEPYVKCGNNSVNVVLNMEFAKVSKEIKLEHLLVVPPVLPVKDDELCSILTNLIDNAIEECERLLENGFTNLSIRLEIYPQSNFLYIKCQNTTGRDRLKWWHSGILSTKEDKISHGYGTQIVAKIAEKHGGCVDYSIKDGEFIAKVLLDMIGEDENAENSVM